MVNYNLCQEVQATLTIYIGRDGLLQSFCKSKECGFKCWMPHVKQTGGGEEWQTGSTSLIISCVCVIVCLYVCHCLCYCVSLCVSLCAQISIWRGKADTGEVEGRWLARVSRSCQRCWGQRCQVSLRYGSLRSSLSCFLYCKVICWAALLARECPEGGWGLVTHRWCTAPSFGT